MHSSRMRTVRSSGRLSGGCLLQKGLSALGGCLLLGGSALGGVVCSGGCDIPACTEADNPPMWTDTCLYKHNLRNFVADGNETDCNHVDSGLDAKESAFRFFNDIDKL